MSNNEILSGFEITQEEGTVRRDAEDNHFSITARSQLGVFQRNPNPGTGEIYASFIDGRRKFFVRYATIASLRIPGLCRRSGVALRDCQRALDGDRDTLYGPLYLLVKPPGGGFLVHDPSQHPPVREDLEGGARPITNNNAFFIEIKELAVVRPLFDTVKTEMGIMLGRAADRAFGLSKSDRAAVHDLAGRIISDSGWTPSALRSGDDVAAQSAAESLMEKLKAVVAIQSDQGKVWRSRSVVEEIKKGALEISVILIRKIVAPRA